MTENAEASNIFNQDSHPQQSQQQNGVLFVGADQGSSTINNGGFGGGTGFGNSGGFFNNAPKTDFFNSSGGAGSNLFAGMNSGKGNMNQGRGLFGTDNNGPNANGTTSKQSIQHQIFDENAIDQNCETKKRPDACQAQTPGDAHTNAWAKVSNQNPITNPELNKTQGGGKFWFNDDPEEGYLQTDNVQDQYATGHPLNSTAINAPPR